MLIDGRPNPLGETSEASSLPSTLGLDILVIWDANLITIDFGADETFSEDVRAPYRAYGWRVLEIDTPTDLDALDSTLREAAERTGRPTLVAPRTVIGDLVSPETLEHTRGALTRGERKNQSHHDCDALRDFTIGLSIQKFTGGPTAAAFSVTRMHRAHPVPLCG